MKKLLTLLLFSYLGNAVNDAVAQESNEELLLKIASKVNANKKSLKDTVDKVSVPLVHQNVDIQLSDLPVVQRLEITERDIVTKKIVKAAKTEPVAPGDILVLDNQNSMMPVRELPSGSRFTFSKSIFFPANTIALVYINGYPSGKVYEGGEPLDNILSATGLYHSACTITTDKSYIKLRGSDTSVAPTFIDFDKIEYIKDGNSKRVIYKLAFKAKAAETHSINIQMACVLPEDKNNDVPSLQMGHVIESFGQSFTFEPPKYVEL